VQITKNKNIPGVCAIGLCLWRYKKALAKQVTPKTSGKNNQTIRKTRKANLGAKIISNPKPIKSIAKTMFTSL
jgi:hypothetical protein